jgi:hypothetical protein
MRSDEDIKTDIFKFIKGSELHRSVSGKLSKRKRPKGSDKEDIVISILANENGQVQTAYVNVNIYVRDVNVDGQDEEDTLRIASLSTLADNLLGEFYGQEYTLKMLSQRVLEVPGAAEHVINNKVEYKTLNE